MTQPLTTPTLFMNHPIIPVIKIHKLEHATPLAKALIAGGISIIEVTLRTPIALVVIEQLRHEFPDILIGAGTVTTVAQLKSCLIAGAQFAFSPGITPSLLEAGAQSPIPFIPGIGVVSELMEGIDAGLNEFKFFPAEIAGGIGLLRDLYDVFSQCRFCPTGGITEESFLKYLQEPNVSCVGGTWLAPPAIMEKEDWADITKRCKRASAALKKMHIKKD